MTKPSWFRLPHDDRAAHRAGLMAKLAPEAKSRFGYLDMMRNSMSGAPPAVANKIDGLLDEFLSLGVRQAEYAEYVDSMRAHLGIEPPSTAKSPGAPAARLIADSDGLNKVVEQIQAVYQRQIDATEGAPSSNLHNEAIDSKHREILLRRIETVRRIADGIINISQQHKLIEDTIGLVNDELRARTPEQLLADIDDVMVQADRLSSELPGPISIAGPGS